MNKVSAPADKPIFELENPGPGLFIDARAEASLSRARERIGVWLSTEGLSLPKGETPLDGTLTNICRHYWADRDHDQRKRLPAIRDEIAMLEERLGSVTDAIAALSQGAKSQLITELMRARVGSGEAFMDDLRAHIAKLRKVCEPLVQQRGSKKGSGFKGVLICCARLIDLRSQLTGKPFSRTWTAKLGEGSSVETFTGRDAQFVLEVIKAIDASVTFTNVRSAGMTLARQSAKKK